MKLHKTLLIITAILLAAGAYSQTVNRLDLCQEIPNLNTQQKQKITKLSSSHQKTMDGLRTQFWSESDPTKASGIKKQMNTEMKNHYQSISALLTPEQQSWFDRNCNANNPVAYRRGQGRGAGRGYGGGQGLRAGRGYGNGRGLGPGRGYRCGRGKGRGGMIN